MAAALRRERNLHGALRAVFSGRYDHWRRFRRETINLLDHQKDAKRHDQETDRVIDEDPIVKRCPWRVRGLGCVDRVLVRAAQVYEQA